MSTRRPCPCVRRLQPCEHLFGADDVMMFFEPYPLVDRPRPAPPQEAAPTQRRSGKVPTFALLAMTMALVGAGGVGPDSGDRR